MDLKWNNDGLIPAVCQDAGSGEVLVVAWMNEEAFERTRATGEAYFWSRSRSSLWHKGETSGNILTVLEMRVDCDRDTLLLLVSASGPACHEGSTSCFRAMTPGQDVETRLSLRSLADVIAVRSSAAPADSYTARLLSDSVERVAQKVGEEAVETVLAAAVGDRDRTVSEIADLLYHLLVLMHRLDIPLDDIEGELAGRRRE